MRAELREYLGSVAAVAAIVGARIRWTRMKQGELLPALVLTKISGVPFTQMSGPAGLADARIQADCYDNTPAGAQALAQAVKGALNAVRFTAGGKRFEGAFVIDERDLSEPAAGDGVQRARISIDFRILHEE